MKFTLISLLLLSFSPVVANASSISNDVDIIFGDLLLDTSDNSQPFYQSVGLGIAFIDGDAIYTLDGSYDVTESWRIFGEYGSNAYWELGLGKTFYFDNLLTEVSANINERGYSLGVFAGFVVTDKFILLSDVNYNWNNNEYRNAGDFVTGYFEPSNTVNVMLGFSWQAIKNINVSYSYNHIYDTDGGSLVLDIEVPKYDFESQHYWKFGKGNSHYHDITLTANIWKFSPYLTYSVVPDIENNVQIGVSFNF